jgi:hypothetical protein
MRDLILEIFQGYKQHTEAFTVFFSKMLVVHFVSTTNCSQIPVVTVTEDFKSLMNEYVMHHEITESVNGDADSNVKLDVATCKNSKEHQQHAGDGENQEEGIIFFKEPGMTLMVVAVEDPQ